jgi:hypothetical protein
MIPPNLKELFPELRISRDPAWEGRDDPWYYVLPCKKGEIYPYGENVLAIEIHSGQLRKKLVGMGFKVVQDGDRESTVVFPVERAQEVLALVRPRKRRILTEEQKDRLRGIGTEHRFQHGSQGRKNGRKRGKSDGKVRRH